MVLIFFMTSCLLLTSITAQSQPTSNIPAVTTTASSAGITGSLNMNDLGTCISGLAQANCQRDTNCINSYFSTHNVCNQISSIYNYTGSWPIAVREYSNIWVIKLVDEKFLLIDGNGKFILPDAALDLEAAPGFLQLKTAYPNAQLADSFEDFPVAVYLSETNNQLLFLQAIISPPCQSVCTPIAIAKVLYGFSISGQYSGASVLRILPDNS
ncbi:MAG: hypothetical protein ACK4PR_00795 [Gammaproteobacteria bacterium]